MSNSDKVYSIGKKAYLNQDGIDYIQVEDPDLFPYVYGTYEIVSVSYDGVEGTVYEGFFNDDPDQSIAEIAHKELNSFKFIGNSITIECDELEEDDGKDLIEPSYTPYFEQKGKELGVLVDSKQRAYGNAVEQGYKVMQVLLEPYEIDDQYMIPQELLLHLLLLTRMIDKVNRIVNNPKFDLMDESPYSDIAGYGLLGSSFSNDK